MKTRQENEPNISSSLLTSPEQAICKQIADHEAPHSQRAVALLALNENGTQTQAAEESGLSVGQVKYWVAEFRKKRLDIFPETLLEGLNAKPKKEKGTDVKVEPEAVKEIAELADDKPKVKKGKNKKGKKSKKNSKKKEKKDRKDKKSKKGKKAKKSKK